MAKQQAPSTIFMVRPASFGFNMQTASSNSFQKNVEENPTTIAQKALAEFDEMVRILQENEIEVIIFDDTKHPLKPDAVFPNNWISLHEEGKLIVYPMLTPNRKLERSQEIIESLQKTFLVNEVIDLSSEEDVNRIVEGTGSLVFDHINKIVYASRSERTHEELVIKIGNILNYRPVVFDAVDETGKAIYHTNVLMCVGTEFAIVCLDTIRSESDQELLLNSFFATNHKVIAISHQQMKAFAGNMLEVNNKKGEPVILVSQSALHSLLPGQVDVISCFADMLPLNITTIETIGGGSVRCMVAGIHTPKR